METSIQDSGELPVERRKPRQEATRPAMSVLPLHQLLAFLPSLRSLSPLRAALLARSCADGVTGWTLGGDSATVDSRVISAENIASVVAQTASSEVRALSQLFECFGRALEARAHGRARESTEILRDAAVWLAEEGRHGEAAALLEVAVGDMRTLDDTELAADVTRRLARASWRAGRLERAADLYYRAWKLFQQLGDRVAQITCLQGLGNVRAAQGRWREAEAEQRVALASCGEEDDLYRGQIYNNLSQINRRLGAIADARAWQRRAEAVWEKNDIVPERVVAYNNAGLLALEEGEPEKARAALLSGLTLATCDLERCVLLVNLAHVAFCANRLDEAEHLAREAEEFAVVAGATDILIDVYTVLGCVARERPDDRCPTFFEKALDLDREGHFPSALAKAHLEYARYRRSVRDEEEAIAHLERALLLHGPGDTPEREEILVILRALSR